MCNDGTIGDASSSGTTLASATASALFSLIWTNFANAEAAVSGSRGGSAAADFAAHKTIALPKMLGRVYGIAGAGSGLTSRVMGKTAGEETHLLDTTEIPNHNHTLTDVGHAHGIDMNPTAASSNGHPLGSTNGGAGYTGTTQSATTGITLAATGGGLTHNNMQPTVFLQMMVKL